MTASSFSRRSLLRVAAAAPLVSVASSAAAQAPELQKGPQARQAPGFYRFRLGDYLVTIVSDGQLSLPTPTLAANVPEATLRSYLKTIRQGADMQRGHLNLTLIDTGEQIILVDAGAGPDFQESAGRIEASLKAAGYSPEDITLVVITHGHPDHVWGILDDAGEAPRFPHAEYAINSEEWRFWTDEKLAERLPEARKPMARGARKNLTAVSARTTRANPDAEVAPGVRLFSAPGHTPGHSGVMVESASERLLVVGDALTHPYISFEQPGWHFGFDMDGEKAAETRKRILEMAASEDMRIALYHAPFPGVGRVAPLNTAYRFIPENWDWNVEPA
ncbi:MBL fold metallo-hydrolase [Dichotomicrobium thermohalophilum]|uniref:Glyoxylase-like metal-dependent hydrolase (Beta-lactamase superfamily II) n=1 Tax=Dichotomicrobium thermohalophilum TaxID=933063 RepID=A0A397Q413_9HYPH|nr:MBL fold metallo-hydrolase [Dichotomicrobium thermohalophilum]RIA56096.1 glyoxylase-like metal-dependent hydrolase (beta-lactamase superfamily II) [Dichotomicrobium thermohalophilum]